MALSTPCVLDTSVLTRLSSPSVRAAVETIPIVVVPTLVALELGHSARNGDELERIDDALAAFEPLDVRSHHVRRARAVQRMLAERGLRGRKVPDLLIAACAEDHGYEVVHYDHDFDHIAVVTSQPTRWIVPAGSID